MSRISVKRTRRAITHSQAERRRAVRLIENGAPWRHVASEFNVSTGVLSRWRRKHGRKPTEPTAHAYSPEDKLAAVMRVLIGESAAAVARDIGAAERTVKSWLYGERLGELELPPVRTVRGRQLYPPAFKRHAVKLLNEGAQITALAAHLGVPDITLRSWRTSSRCGRDQQ